ncbi:MAG: dephospho-CoA kinase, partial [Eubacterium sp.]|nr:dephospho-CoA kinase [Eubacterium sp.]
MQRLMESRGYTKEKTESIMASQLSEDEFRRHCAVVIDNNGSHEESFLQIDQALLARGITK